MSATDDIKQGIAGLARPKPGRGFLARIIDLSLSAVLLALIAATIAAIVALTVGAPAWLLRFCWNSVAPARPLGWPAAVGIVVLAGWFANLFRRSK